MARRRQDIAELLETALGKTADAGLLDALLEAYRSRPLPALAGLIEIAGKRAAVQHPMKGSLNVQHATWKTVAAGKGATDVEWLIANAITSRAEYSIERIERLKDWPADPRLSSGLLALADGKKMTSRQSRWFWRHAFDIIGKQVHARLSSILEPMLAIQPQTEFDNWLLKKLRITEARIGRLQIPAPSTTETAVLAKLAERLDVAQEKAAAKTADDFLKEIWAAPDDDGPREVFADWLQERSDPRGEFIALQLTRARKRKVMTGRIAGGGTIRVTEPDDVKALARERALLAKYQKAWVAPFEPVLSIPKSTFERGFLHTVFVHWRKLASVPALMTHPAWATVRRFSLDAAGARVCDPWIEHMVSLGAKWD